MKRDGNELDDDLLNKIEDCGDEETYQDDICMVFPIPCGFIATPVVVCRDGEKGDEDGEPPKKECGRDFQHASHAFPLLTTISESASNNCHDVRNAFGDDLEIVLE